MGNTIPNPQWYPVCCILKNWDTLKLEDLRKKCMIFFCIKSRPQYKLESRESWPQNGSLNYNTVLQLDLYCRRLGKWSENGIYVQAFRYLYQNPALCSNSCQTSLTTKEASNILDDPLLNCFLTTWRDNVTAPARGPPSEDSQTSGTSPINCCTPEEKQCTWEATRQYANQQHGENPDYPPAEAAVPGQDLEWVNTTGETHASHIWVQMLLAGREKALKSQ